MINLLSIQKKQQGITLIEVLVTVLVTSVGALGIASMQLTGLKYTSGSYARTQAVLLADDMANRIKANRSEALNIAADGGFAAGSPYQIANFNTPIPAGFINCLVQNCTDQQLAAYDLATWQTELARVLPAGQGRITIVDSTNPNGIDERQFNISVQWRQVANSVVEDSDPADELRNFTFRISL